AGDGREARVHEPVVGACEVRAADQRTHAPQRAGQREEERQEDRAECGRDVDADERARDRARVPGARDDPAVQRVDRERREEVCRARDVHPRDEEYPRGTRPLRERDEPEQQAEERAEEGALRPLGEAERLGEPPRGLHGRRHHACRVVMPPSTGMTAPVRYAPAREARSRSGRQVRVRWKTPFTFKASTLSHAESGYSASGAPQLAPALLTRM